MWIRRPNVRVRKHSSSSNLVGVLKQRTSAPLPLQPQEAENQKLKNALLTIQLFIRRTTSTGRSGDTAWGAWTIEEGWRLESEAFYDKVSPYIISGSSLKELDTSPANYLQRKSICISMNKAMTQVYKHVFFETRLAFRRFWDKEPRHPYFVLAKMCYFYPRTRQVPGGAPPAQR